MPEKDAPIILAPHDPKWAELFLEEEVILSDVLSEWLAGPIEHIGSTAVPALTAKPVIDIMAAVRSLSESQGAIESVRKLNYLHAPYRSDVMHWFCKPSPAHRPHHLHLVPYNSSLWKSQLRFRDRLIGDAKAAAEYSELKQMLALRFRDDRDAYTDGKSEFIARFV